MAPIHELTVGGLRGLSTEQTIRFAIPNDLAGSGLTILVGANNSGKSTYLEALRLATQAQPASFSVGKRNRHYGDRVSIKVSTDSTTRTLISVNAGGSESLFNEGTPASSSSIDIFTVPSRRAFSAYFSNPGRGPRTREQYSTSLGTPALKSPVVNGFEMRLFAVDRDPNLKSSFDAVFGKLVSPVPEWTIDQSDDGQYFVKFKWGSKTSQVHDHTSDGLGDGLVSLMSIVDALYDSEPGATLVFDEPELSLHPQMQRRLRRVLSQYAADRQIIYSTHSPYFVDWSDISNGAEIVRCFKEKSRGAVAAQSTSGVLSKIARLADDTHNPHILGLDANEVFFLEDRIILVEGQEDVVHMPKVASQLGAALNGSLFGWGVGGAEKMTLFAQLLHDLRYRKVAGILDGDKKREADSLTAQFPDYKFASIEADDIRTKPRPGRSTKIGLLDESYRIRREYVESTHKLLDMIDQYLTDDEDANELTT